MAYPLSPAQMVTLTALPDDKKALLGWGGACSGMAPTCVVNLNSDLAVSAIFGKAASGGGGKGNGKGALTMDSGSVRVRTAPANR